MPSHSLLPAQRPSRAAPGCQVSHETLDNMGCAIRAPRVWRGEMQSSRVAEQAKVAQRLAAWCSFQGRGAPPWVLNQEGDRPGRQWDRWERS